MRVHQCHQRSESHVARRPHFVHFSVPPILTASEGASDCSSDGAGDEDGGNSSWFVGLGLRGEADAGPPSLEVTSLCDGARFSEVVELEL